MRLQRILWHGGLLAAYGLGGLLAACGGNQWGYAPEYAPLDAEEGYLEQEVELSYEEVRRDPAAYQGRIVGWFGVVQSVQPATGSDRPLVTMMLRFHQPRHLCSDHSDGSCRVTISAKEGGSFSAHLKLRPEDMSGVNRLHEGSLVKVYGSPLVEYDPQGGPMLEAAYFRHWPHGKYVTTHSAGAMRR
jgi:hypothetical protein